MFIWINTYERTGEDTELGRWRSWSRPDKPSDNPVRSEYCPSMSPTEGHGQALRAPPPSVAGGDSGQARDPRQQIQTLKERQRGSRILVAASSAQPWLCLLSHPLPLPTFSLTFSSCPVACSSQQIICLFMPRLLSRISFLLTHSHFSWLSSGIISSRKVSLNPKLGCVSPCCIHTAFSQHLPSDITFFFFFFCE